MLVLTRQVDQDICIGGNVRVRVLSIHGGQVRLGVEAPAEVSIYRGELMDAIRRETEAARTPGAEAVDAMQELARQVRGSPALRATRSQVSSRHPGSRNCMAQDRGQESA